MSQPLQQLTDAGVSIWLDDLSRGRLTIADNKSLSYLVEHYRVTGVTTNPSIFANAVKGSDLYRNGIAQHKDAESAIRELTCADVQQACDILKPVFDSTNGVDGRVSIEVDPRLAHDTNGTIAEGKELWAHIQRPNLLIKVPATRAGLPAITALIAAGISVNVTLIFSLSQYADVMKAYQDGINARREAGASLEGIESVASFFVSRLDTEIDKRLNAIGTAEALVLRGKAGIANARLAYRLFEETFKGWEHVQRPLWASTGVKDPAYSDTMYVDQLVARQCVNTMPESTLLAVADHANVAVDSAAQGYVEADNLFAALGNLGIDYNEVVELLEREGVSKFIDSWNDLIATVNSAIG